MDTKYIDKCVKQIEVIGKENEDVEVINNSPLKMIGKGRQGAVFHVTDDKCLKVYGEIDDCNREYYALSLGQDTNLFPKIYAKGSNYVVMEFIGGVDLREYLQSQPLTVELSQRLIDMLIVFKRIGFERIDHHKRQIYLQEDGSLKVIDVGRTVWRDRVYPYPRKLINSLGTDLKDVFLSHVKFLAPELYEEWRHYIEMEELSTQLTKVLLESEVKPKKLKKKAKELITTNNQTLYETKLEDLLFKVFKEEWIKVMLAHGEDPDKIDDLIKSHLKGEENGKKSSKRKKESDKSQHNVPSKYRYSKKKKKK